MLTFNVYDRVFFIKGCNGDYATAFTIDVDSRQYLIGAKHVLGEDGQISSIALFHNGLWEDISVNFIGTAQGEIDITVLAPHVRLSA